MPVEYGRGYSKDPQLDVELSFASLTRSSFPRASLRSVKRSSQCHGQASGPPRERMSRILSTPYPPKSQRHGVRQPETVTEAADSVQREIPRAAPSQLRAFMQPETVVAAVLLTATSLGLYRFYKSYLQRIPQASNISPGFLRRRSLVGKVTSVGDGDNFRMYHTPGGRLAGWGWLPGRQVPADKKELKDQTVLELYKGKTR